MKKFLKIALFLPITLLLNWLYSSYVFCTFDFTKYPQDWRESTVAISFGFYLCVAIVSGVMIIIKSQAHEEKLEEKFKAKHNIK